MYDFIRQAKSMGIPVGPGRGSGVGSLAAYCIGITGVDPLRYDLLFERFLNPERVSMPDFDVDFSDERRQEIIEYVTEKYGTEFRYYRLYENGGDITPEDNRGHYRLPQ